MSDDPRIARVLMYLTYAVGVAGLAIAMSTVNDSPATLSTGCLLAVGAGGILSFLRHSVFNRSDARRMGWDYGTRNNFQIEVGLANLAWGTLAVLAVVLDWGIHAEAASFLVFGFYMASVAAMVALPSDGERVRPWPMVVTMAAFGGLMLYVGFQGMAA